MHNHDHTVNTSMRKKNTTTTNSTTNSLQGLSQSGALSPFPSQEGSECPILAQALPRYLFFVLLVYKYGAYRGQQKPLVLLVSVCVCTLGFLLVS